MSYTSFVIGGKSGAFIINYGGENLRSDKTARRSDPFQYDQYDTPKSRWLVLYDDHGVALAGIRLLPTTHRVGIYSYWLRDAQRGMFSETPSNLLDSPAPVDENAWEFSRLIVLGDLQEDQYDAVHEELFVRLRALPKEWGVDILIGVVPKFWERDHKLLGKNAVFCGPEFQLEGQVFRALKVYDLRPKHLTSEDLISSERKSPDPIKVGADEEAREIDRLGASGRADHENWIQADLIGLAKWAEELKSKTPEHVSSIQSRCDAIILRGSGNA